MVRQFRQLFENEMTEHLTGLVERTTGRAVINYQSQIMFEPVIVVEMFFFSEPRQDGIEATAEGQAATRRAADPVRAWCSDAQQRAMSNPG